MQRGSIQGGAPAPQTKVSSAHEGLGQEIDTAVSMLEAKETHGAFINTSANMFLDFIMYFRSRCASGALALSLTANCPFLIWQQRFGCFRGSLGTLSNKQLLFFSSTTQG